MKLLRVGEKGAERPALLDEEGRLYDISSIVGELDGAALSDASIAAIRASNRETLPRLDAGQRIGVPVANIGKLIGVGLNYSDHAAESNQPVPTEPILFMKATSAICGPYDDVELPVGAEATDWEVELGFVIGKRAKNVAVDDALNHVAGYLIVNDVSERNWQIQRQGQWMKGKSSDTFAPLGPWLVTRDEVVDPQNLALKLQVSGVPRQNGNTRTMIFSVAYLVHYISQFMTLNPGDVVTTGTPPGVGLGLKPPVYLKDGDVMRLEVEGLGYQQQQVRSFTS
jgi:2-keto-4-pentenoate hydratase/2-oxohepta-3-ene-1,7-dioic acid hydratase in catechol pathway